MPYYDTILTHLRQEELHAEAEAHRLTVLARASSERRRRGLPAVLGGAVGRIPGRLRRRPQVAPAC
jgi:hypothetical protein